MKSLYILLLVYFDSPLFLLNQCSKNKLTHLTIQNEDDSKLKTATPEKKVLFGDTICFVVGSKYSAGVNNIIMKMGLWT